MISIPDFVRHTAQTCQHWGVPYQLAELQVCEQLVIQLMQTLDASAARLLFEELVTTALQATAWASPWGWVAAELRFELRVARLGQHHRHRLAAVALTADGIPDDQALDLFNDRLQRPFRWEPTKKSGCFF
jgi:hypothetical protein